jgi:hypothetical protein
MRTKNIECICLTLRGRLFYMAFLVIVLSTSPAAAGPWADVGDLGLRHDLQLLSDAELISGTLTTWPLPWGDICRDLDGIDISEGGAAWVAATVRRVRKRLEKESTEREIRISSHIAFSAKPLELRTFNASPSDAAEIGAGVEWTGRLFAYRLRVIGVYDPDDERELRFDGSYVSLLAPGNWALSVDAVDRWWGPGWEGSLILSNNARPVPSVVLQRYDSEPFESRWLRWVGPWRLVFFLGQMESSRSVSRALFLGMRLNFKPLESMEIGLSRTAQWGGKGRPEDFDTFLKLLVGKDNMGSKGVTAENEPGNQLAGYDVRWVSPFLDLPYAVYGQFIGEDEAGGLPSRYIGMAGIETWGGLSSCGASWRFHVEYADTAVDFFHSEPLFDFAYNHSIYKDGYRYYDRSLGHAMDNDGQMLSVGMLLMDGKGRVWNLLGRWTKLNRDGFGFNSVADEAEDVLDLELDNTLDFREDTTLSWGVGLQKRRLEETRQTSLTLRLFFRLTHEF